MRFLLIDRITIWEPPIRAAAVKCVSLSDDVFVDHFPREPIMPGSLILEGMAQLSGLLLEEAAVPQAGRVKALMTVVEKAKFRRQARPGERLTYHAEVLSVNEAGGKAEVTATIDDAVCAEARLMFAFAAYRNERLDALQRTAMALWMRDLTTP
jgi:3-hydroxyacyl-[acyl-carrier-protein] dehydratase